MGLSIGEWIESNHFEKLWDDMIIHIMYTTLASKEDAEIAARCIIISLRQELESRNENARHSGKAGVQGRAGTY